MDDELDIELRAPAEVARRCIILATLLRRLSLESIPTTQSDDLDGEAFDLKAWLQTEDLWQHVTAFEAAFLSQPVGQIDDDDVVSVAWQGEALGALAWSMRLVDTMRPGDASAVARIVEQLPAPWDQTAPWVRGASLRAEPDIARERDRAEIIEWRVALELPRRLASPSLQREYAEAIAEVAREAHAAGLIERIVDDDFPIGGLTLGSRDDETLERMTIVAEERLRALNWLCGFGETWDTVPLDV
jgi:hypothetical protein